MNMTYQYPFGSFKNTEHDISNQITMYRGGLPDIFPSPVIEIGGPTTSGYHFLENAALGSRPMITNISDNPVPYDPQAKELASYVEAVVDGTRLPFEDRSVGTILMKSMSISSDWWAELSEPERIEKSSQFEEEFRLAKIEMAQIVDGSLEPDNVKYAQRVTIFREIVRVLRTGGYLITNGTDQDIQILERLGFQKVAVKDREDDNDNHELPYPEFVVIKPE